MKKIYTFNSETLEPEIVNTVKYKAYFVGSLLLFFILLSSFISAKKEISEKDLTIQEKDRRINQIETPLREDFYIEDLVIAIGHKFSPKELEQIEDIAYRYKDKVEEAKIPMTLLIWIAYKESRFDSKAKNPNSTACGFFGFVDGTWNEMCKLKGVKTSGRFDEDKQVDILITYLNYLYERKGSWELVMKSYHGGTLQYPFKFLVK